VKKEVKRGDTSAVRKSAPLRNVLEPRGDDTASMKITVKINTQKKNRANARLFQDVAWGEALVILKIPLY
jgi:hypothetical protein